MKRPNSLCSTIPPLCKLTIARAQCQSLMRRPERAGTCHAIRGRRFAAVLLAVVTEIGGAGGATVIANSQLQKCVNSVWLLSYGVPLFMGGFTSQKPLIGVRVGAVLPERGRGDPGAALRPNQPGHADSGLQHPLHRQVLLCSHHSSHKSDSIKCGNLLFSSNGVCPCTCNYATTPSCGCRDLAQTINVSFAKSPVYSTYPLTYMQAFNYQPTEVRTSLQTYRLSFKEIQQ